jgi:pSer/pThr/pTyr-binding forkhead associated (FHA) protein
MDMVFCPACKHANPSSAAICQFCGADLGRGEESKSGEKTRFKTKLLPEEGQAQIADHSPAAPAQGIAIYVISSNRPVLVSDKQELILGRRAPNDPVNDDLVDLVDYGAYECGVSRRHASIVRTENGYQITDLGSPNGTWLEQVRLVANQPYPLKSLSKIFLGRLHLILVYK